MHVDFKVTTWERVEIPEEHKEKVKQAIKNGKVESANDLFNLDLEMQLDCEMLQDTSEQLTVDENKGCSTIEIWENDSLDGNRNPMKMTWQNGNDR